MLLAFTACKEPDPSQPHESTITAFGKTAKVTGDASISSADFATAVENLREALIYTGNYFSGYSTNEKAQLNNIMERGITIVPGNAIPASVNGALTVGVGYLKSKDRDTIIEGIFVPIDANALL